jgi:hypothetical protein
MTWLPSFVRHRNGNSDRYNAEGGLVAAPELIVAELVQGKVELDESMAQASHKRMGRWDDLLH